MQDRYAGDIGDFGKFGLLRALRSVNFSIGVNWYKVDTLECEKNLDGSYKQDDGKNLIPENLRICDKRLADVLMKIAVSKDRSIGVLERANLIEGAGYFQDCLSVEKRAEWHEDALRKLGRYELVFLDPDNGMLVKSVGKQSKKSVKYTFYEEVRDYLERGQSVLVYNHRCRKPEDIYFGELYKRFHTHIEIDDSQILRITFPRGTKRDYLAICATEEHRKKIQQVFFEMETSIWGETGMCYISR